MRSPPDQRERLNRQPEAVRENIFKEFATSWIKANPSEYVKLCPSGWRCRSSLTCDNPKAQHGLDRSRIALLPLTIAGLVMAWRRKWHLVFPLLVWGSALLTYTLTVTANRFAIPFEPLQLALTALVISHNSFPRHACGQKVC